MRLDLFLSENRLVDSRTDAKNFVISGSVTVNGKVVTKPSFDVSDNDSIEIDKSSKKYVSRGGLKLESALFAFDVDPTDCVCIDIGASSGGFTDCLLQKGAKKVIAVDSGSGQMVESLRKDRRVIVIENFNARYMTREDFDFIPSLAVMDVSFISAKLIFPSVYQLLPTGGRFVSLIKPQFEVGRAGLNKKGVVKNETLRKNALKDVISFAEACGFKHRGTIESPITGGDGNVEYLAYFVKE
jgi:23S rRNA (cytidine1920-2'-O)/16S rRNA (cytidine1409-2'-O)-methyltransferase